MSLMAEHAIGVVGLATMGMNLARNLASHGASVAVYNRTRRRTDEFMSSYGGEGEFTAAFTLEELTKALRPPRAILIMVKAGTPVDEAIDALSLILKPGDTLIDGGNSLFHDTRRRAAAAAQRGLGFLGMGVSGGEEGALHGPSLMPGGPRESYDRVEQMLNAISAKVDGVPCCTYIGPDGAGHFVKMVHNGIEYADIQLIAESYDFLRQALGLDANELAAIFRDWNDGELQSYLIEITADVLGKRDDGAGAALVDQIEDEAEQKGTGRWTSQSALELGVPLTGITEAVFARMLSSQKRERVTASSILGGPTRGNVTASERSALVDDMRDALYAAKIVAYAQGFEHLAAGSNEYRWDIDLGSLATIWRGGCIIRAKFLNRIRDAYADQPELANLMLAPFFKDAIESSQGAWRRVVKHAVDAGVPIPAFASSLAYYDGYRRARGPAITLDRIPIAASIVRAHITRAGRRTAPRSGPTRPDRLGRVLPEDEEDQDEGKRQGRQAPVGDEGVGEGDARDRGANDVHAAEHDRKPEPPRRVAHLPAQSAWPEGQDGRAHQHHEHEADEESPQAARLRSSARFASSVVTRWRLKLRSANRSHAVSAADAFFSSSCRYQCSHSWQYRKRRTSRLERKNTFSDSHEKCMPLPRLRRAP